MPADQGFKSEQPAAASSHVARGTEHVARGTEHVAHGTEHVARGTEHAARGTEHAAHRTVARRTSPVVALTWRSATQARYVMLGCACLLTGFQIVIVGQASALEHQHSFSRMAEFVPAFLQRGLGNKSLLLASFKGTVAFGYFHPIVAVLVSVLAIYLTTEPAHEVESGLVDLTLARPVPRHVVVTRSLLLAVGALTMVAVLMFGGTRVGLRLFASPEFDVPSAAISAQLLLHLAAVALCFGGFGLAVAAGARRWSTAFTTAALAAVVLYLVDFLAIGWPVMRPLAWLSPFHYYPALSILAGDAPAWRNIGILMSASAIFSAIGYWRFSRRDL
jgi:ABC-type transport system involved in multi-copper enzyme maturation permease subunit